MTEAAQDSKRPGQATPGGRARALWVSAATAAALALIIAGSLVAWNNGVRDRLFPKRWGVVVENQIYRSGRIHPALMEATLSKNGVKAIVNLCGKDEHSGPEDLAATKLGIEVTYVPMSGDGTADAARYATAVGKVIEMRKAGKPVLVHCAAGTQRTGGVIAVYRLLVEKASPAEVIKEMRRYGWRPGQNNNRLPEFINKNLPEIADILARQGAISSTPSPLPVLP